MTPHRLRRVALQRTRKRSQRNPQDFYHGLLVDPKLVRLIRRMATANPLWGAPRIHGELLKLGIEVSERTVSRYMPEQRKPPSQSWRTFLKNHMGDFVSIDLFTVPTTRFQALFCLLVLSHDRRRVLHFNVTDHRSAEWAARQIVQAFP